MIVKNYIPNLPKIPFEHGYIGIVMHSTAVYGDTTENERQYECAHFGDAYVHAFCDRLGILEVADPNYIAFGAGQVANKRYLHVELCQVKNDGTPAAQDAFKTSYGNWIEYAATKLYERKLGVLGAAADGTGTVWQHAQVSKFLGGTNHDDPMPYLSEWNVTWSQVIDDIHTKYKELQQMDEILARLKVLEDAALKIAAPDWFVQEFKSADLGGLIKEPSKSKEFWETTATILRAVKWQPAT